MEIKRDNYLEKLKIRKHNRLIKVITGVRRSGKSYLLNEIFYKDLLNSGVNDDHIVKFSFDSAKDLALIGEDYYELRKNNQKIDPKKFMQYIESKIKDDEIHYLLLDEIQHLDVFEYVLNGYLRESNLDVYVTGSNSRFLSTDIITEFRGRGDEVHIYPLSFSEFCALDNNDYTLDDYMTYGGLPAVVLMQHTTQKIDYLKTHILNVYLSDIVNRNNLPNDSNLRELLSVLASGTATLINPYKLSNTFKSVKRTNVSVQTIDKYINYMEEAFLISRAIRYDIKGKKYINTPFKIYFEDVGLRNAQLDFTQVESNHLMENIIYNELRYRGYSVHVGLVQTREQINGQSQRKQLEIDFVANIGSKRYYIQSAYDIPSGEKMKQETRPFDKLGDSFKKIIVVEKPIKERRDINGYMTIGLKEFLLNPNSLDL